MATVALGSGWHRKCISGSERQLSKLDSYIAGSVIELKLSPVKRLKEFVTIKPALQIIFEGILQTEEKTKSATRL